MRLFFVAFLLLASHFSLPTSVFAHSQIQVIKMTTNGFEPQEVTLDENSTLIFKNDDKVPRWPASNIHPTHDLYPEFDPKGEIAPGESWSFKPKKAGKWNYHDHLKPHIRGTVIIAKEESSPDSQTSPTSLNILESLKNTFASLLDKIRSFFTSPPKEIAKPEEFKKLTPEKQFETLTNFAKAKGGNFSWKYITDTYKGEAGSSGNIHDLAHLAGKLLYEDKGILGIGICTPVFAFGCYHGLLDTAFKTSLEDLPQAERECEKLGPVGSGPYGSCVHGIGHGVASFHNTQNLKASLASCEKLKTGQGFCHDGVFMEFVRGAPDSFYSRLDPLYPCNSLEREYGSRYSMACGRNQPPLLMGRLGLEFNQAAKICEDNKLSSEFKDACFSALGFSLASGDTDSIIRGCKTIKDNFYTSRCLQAAAGELIFQDTPGWQEKSIKVCNASQPQFQKSCSEHLTRLIKEYGKVLEQKFNLLKDGQDKEGYVRQEMRICYEGGSKNDCYKKVALLLSNQLGLKGTLEIFKKNESHPEIYARCHETTHYLSRFEYQKTKSIPQVYSQCDSTCHGGCYHGVLEQYLKEKNLALDGIYKEFPGVCGEEKNFTTPLIFNECLHGMGHAAMFVTDMEVPESLKLCDTLPDQEAMERCYGGVFMENSSSSTNVDHPGKYIKANDPLYPCNTLPEKYSRLCYRYQSSHFALISSHDWNKVANLCLSVPETYQDDCFRTIGTNQVGFVDNKEEWKKNCSIMPNEHFEGVCVGGVVSSLAYRFVGEPQKMIDFCSSVSGEHQKGCFRQMGTGLTDWSNDSVYREQICNQIRNKQFASWCKNV